ncbi:MAG: hypothetical protein HYR90_00615 [Candidatus Andersenbacteria bacterium]|nr:hypothetical protein [Candidatus Andersenbacteria bacterium]MBI3251247.1 hypothetical protein [Candidatus Andersenbacteria bacterium]
MKLTLKQPRFFASLALWWDLLIKYSSVREKMILLVLLAVAIGSAIFTVSGFVRRNTTLIAQAGGAYTEGAVGQPRHINPILAGSNDLDRDISNVIFSSLFKVNSNLEFEGDLASAYTISEDGRTYTITLKENITWHDGAPFTAEDVLFTIRSIQTPDYDSPLESSFQGVQVAAPDPRTVVFTLKEPYAPFLQNLTVGIVPKHVWEAVPPQNAALAEQMLKPVGTGPFKFAEITTRRRTGEITALRLVRNDSYYGQHTYLDELVFSFYATPDEALAALTTNQVDGVSFLPVSLAESVKNRSGITIHRLLLPQYFGLFFNPVKNDLLSDAGIRDALVLATDRQAIITEALAGEAKSLHTPIPPGMFTFNGEVDAPTFNPDVARQNLEEAGWKDEDGNGIREKAGKELRFVITTTDWPEYAQTAELVKKQWEAIGVAVETQSHGAGAIQQTVVGPRDYEVLLYGEVLSVDPDPYAFWHSTQTRNPGLNLSLFKDQQVDKLLEEARKTLNVDERKAKYADFQQRFLELNPAIILYQPYYLFAQRDDVRGLTVEQANLPDSRFNDVELWHVRTKRIWNST